MYKVLSFEFRAISCKRSMAAEFDIAESTQPNSSERQKMDDELV